MAQDDRGWYGDTQGHEEAAHKGQARKANNRPMKKEEENKMSVFKSNITLLRSVSTKLAYNLTMNGGQVILGKKNQAKKNKAEEFIYKAIRLLEEIR